MLSNVKFYNCHEKSQPLDCVLIKYDPAHILWSCFFKIILYYPPISSSVF